MKSRRYQKMRQSLVRGIVLSLLIVSGSRAEGVGKKSAAEGTPTRAIQDLDKMLDDYKTNPTTPEDQKNNEEVKKKVLHGTFDIAELCRLALANHWQKMSEKDRKYFVDLLTRLLEQRAVFSKEQSQHKNKARGGADYYVTYKGDRFLNDEKTKALTQSRVRVPSENIEIDLDYKLKKVGAIWKIFDVIVDGASLLDNYRYQFDKIIKKDGYADLIRRMESKLKELEKKG
ncbi:MAG: ABC transporter substrate-binding protein [Deltaproteobacteria bacterium]|nr:ABC transporter substrate-binding protein [Deltaproteobacteria bacterium]